MLYNLQIVLDPFLRAGNEETTSQWSKVISKAFVSGTRSALFENEKKV